MTQLRRMVRVWPRVMILSLLLPVSATAWGQACVGNSQWRIPITIDNTGNSNAFTDLEVQVTVDTATLVGSGHMAADGADVRFTDGTNCTCHTLESGFNTANTEYWVRVPAVPASGSTTIYMYYGDPVATSTDDPYCTFAFYEGFEDATLGMTNSCGNLTTNVSGGIGSLSWTSSGNLISDTLLPVANVYTAEAEVTGASGTWPAVYWYKDAPDHRGHAIMINSTQARISETTTTPTDYCSGHNWSSTLINYTDVVGQWQITWVATGDQRANFPTIGPITSTSTTHARDADMRVGLGGISSGSGSMDVDWVRARQFADPAPMVMPGPEQGANNTIEITKDTVPDGPQDFDFSGDLGMFSLDDDADGTLPNSASFMVFDGSYAVTEAVAAGFSLTDLSCNDPSGGTTIDLGAATVTIDVAGDETVTCTFTNTEQAEITIVKDAVPDNAQDFDYSSDLGAFTLDDDADGTLPNSFTASGVPPGTYSVTENVPAGWSVTAINCNDGNSSGDLGTATATIITEPGESVTCTFENQNATDVAVDKQAAQNAGNPTQYDFLLTVTNNGPGDATNLVVQDMLPQGMAYVANDCGASVAGDPLSGETVTWTIGTLAASSSVNCTITTAVLAAGAIVNEATFSMDQMDTNPTNDVGTVSLTVGFIAIPTLSGIPMVLLAFLMAVVGVMTLRRQTG